MIVVEDGPFLTKFFANLGVPRFCANMQIHHTIFPLLVLRQNEGHNVSK
jgi:hypothetical protein